MYECEEAIYQASLWKASSLKDRNGNYIQELRLKMRTESQNRKFICPECGEPLILNAGNIRQPYFSHYTGSECVLTNKEQGERNRRMRDAMLYFASLSFPDATILQYEPLRGSLRSQIMVHTQDKKQEIKREIKIALNYVSDFVKHTQLENKMDCMKEMGILPIWFTPCRPDGQERLTTAEYQISTQQPLLLSIDCKNSLIYIKKCDDKGIRVIREKAYPLSEVRLNEQGQIVFREQTEPAGQTAAQMRADGQSGQAKENAEGRECLEKGDTHEKESDYTAADSYKDANREETGSYKKLAFGKLLAARMFELAEKSGNSRQSYSLDQVVFRISQEDYMAIGPNVYSQAHYMKSLGLYWLPKKLKGNSRERKNAAVIRDCFLEYVDNELMISPGKWEKGDWAGRVLQVLEEFRESGIWLKAADDLK